jgi:hypothetical protein
MCPGGIRIFPNYAAQGAPMAKANRSSGESLWESLMMEGQSKADCEFMIAMPSFDSGHAIQKERKIMENFFCSTCGGKGTMKKACRS